MDPAPKDDKQLTMGFAEVRLADYEVSAHGMVVKIKISSGEDFVPLYELTIPGIGTGTKLLLESLRVELTTMVPINPFKIQSAEYIQEINTKYIEATNVLIDKYLPGQDSQMKKVLTSYMLNMMLGLGEIEFLIADDNLEEIAINGSTNYIWIFHKVHGWCKTNISPPSEDSIYNQAEQIGRRIGREINNLSPFMDAELSDGSRVNATLFPLSQVGNTITIRKFAKNPWTMPAMIKNNTINLDLAALIWLCVENEISLLISGGTASGKTSFLNALSIFFPTNRRIVSVEETRELTLPKFLQWIPMVTRQPNPEGRGEVTLYNLMINALRQRPDIMIVGEVRTGKDAETLFEAIHTGHAVYGTVHADNAEDTIVRMTNPPIATPKIMLNAIGGLIVLFRHRRRGIRRVLEFAEILRTGDAKVIYRWDINEDVTHEITTLTTLQNTLYLYSGLTKEDVENQVAEKSTILKYMADNGVVDVDNAGFLVANYYKNKKLVLRAAQNNVAFSSDMFKENE